MSDAPRGYEKIDVEHDGYEPSPMMTIGPEGWHFYEMNREGGKTIVTFIRKLKQDEFVDVSVSAWVSTPHYGKEVMQSIRDALSSKIRHFVEECIVEATGKPAHDFHVTYNTTTAKGFHG